MIHEEGQTEMNFATHPVSLASQQTFQLFVNMIPEVGLGLDAVGGLSWWIFAPQTL